MAFTHSPKIVTDGLYLCLDASDKVSYPGSGTTWTDLSGNGHHGTLSEAAIGTVSSSLSEGVLAFEGDDEIVTIAHDTSFGYAADEDWTLCFWFMVTGTNSGFLVSKRDGSTKNWNVQHSAGDDQLHFAGGSTGGGNFSCPTVAGDVPENVYLNWVGVHQGTADKVFVYINGVLNNSVTKTGATTGNFHDSDLYIGKIINQEYFIGRVGSFIGYTKALSAKEVLQNFNAHHSIYRV